MDSYSICYNLVVNSATEIPLLPEAFIVPIIDDQLGYVEKIATFETLDSYNIPYTDTPHETLLEICTALKPKMLEQRFKPLKKKKAVSLSELLKDPTIKKVLLDYIDKKLAVFYNLVISNNYSISYKAQRKDPIEGFKLTIADNKLKPILEFTKTNDGIEYAFSLKNNETPIILKDHDIQILLNEPSWVVLNQHIYQIENLNANKLKPFFDKDKITIAQKHIKIYLEKVIIPVVKNVDVITNGFDIRTQSEIQSYRIEIIQDFIRDIYVAKVVFEYNSIFFDYHSAKTTSSNVSFKNDDQIQIIQTKRDPEAEQKIINLLLSKGLKANSSLLFELESPNDPFEILEWLKLHKSQLEEDGFNIQLPTIEGKAINNSMSNIKFDSKKKMIGSTLRES